MSFNLSFKTVLLGMLQLLILGGIGFTLVKRRVIRDDGLAVLSRLVVELTLPLLIFTQLIEGFNFNTYRNWWWFPILSLVITAVGLGIGKSLSVTYPGLKERREFISLIGFQNSGYLPLVLFAAIFPSYQARQLFIYLFLFLVGFNLVIWSWGAWYLTRPSSTDKKGKSDYFGKGCLNWALGGGGDCDLLKLFSPPVVATVASLMLVAVGLNRFIPAVTIKPLKMVGECTMPLAMLVVGGNLAAISAAKIDRKTISYLIFAKLVLLPLIAFIAIMFFRPPALVGFLIIAQAAMPSATSLSLIARHYQLEGELINQGILFTHLVSIVTIPLFLMLFSACTVSF